MREGKNGWEKPNYYWMEKSAEKMKREIARLHIYLLHVTCDGIPFVFGPPAQERASATKSHLGSRR